MNRYTCPMHQEIKQDKPGNCPKCGMKLVPQGSQEAVSYHSENDKGLGRLTWKSYIPLVVIIGLLFLTTLTISLRDLQAGIFSIFNTLSYFMIGFFLTFAGFKLMDLRGFAEG